MNYPLRMTHPEHGAMHVYNEADMEKQLKRGWQAETPVAAPVEAPVKRKYIRKAKA